MRAVATASARGAPGSARLGRARGSPPSRRFGDRARTVARRARRSCFARIWTTASGPSARADRGAARPSTPRAPHPRKRGRTSPSAPRPRCTTFPRRTRAPHPPPGPATSALRAPRADDTADARPRGFDRRDALRPRPAPSHPSLTSSPTASAPSSRGFFARCPPPRTLPPAPSPASSRGPCPSPPCAPSPTSYGHASSSPYSSDSSPRSCSSADSPSSPSLSPTANRWARNAAAASTIDGEEGPETRGAPNRNRSTPPGTERGGDEGNKPRGDER